MLVETDRKACLHISCLRYSERMEAEGVQRAIVVVIAGMTPIAKRVCCHDVTQPRDK